MTLRRKFVLYLLLVHFVFASAVVYLLWDNRLWLLAMEAFFVVSFIIALRLFRGLFLPMELIASGVEFIREGDFATRLREIGQPEMDALIGVYNRMLDRLRAERIRTQEQHYLLEKIMNVSPAAIVILDYDGRVSFANPAAESLLQLPRGDLTGQRLETQRSPLATAMSALADGESVIVPLRGVRRARCLKSHFLDQGHTRTFYLLEEMTEELRKTQKAAYEKLIRMMSHEVNNSLGAANSLLHSCLRYQDQLAGEDRQDYASALAVVIARTEHLGAFMKSFADIVKLPLPQRRPADVGGILKNITQLLGAEFARRRIRLVWETEGTPPPLLMDEHQIEQVFLNILKNAMEAIGADGTITIRLAANKGKPLVVIEDTGGGISEEAKRQLFTPFFSTKENGQGIGLTVVQEILTRHNFEFALDSSPGQPTRFTVSF